MTTVRKVEVPLEVRAGFKIPVSPAAGQVLTSDAAGNGSWQAVPSYQTTTHPVCMVVAKVNTTVSAPGASINGVPMVAGARVLLTAQTTGAENGIWVWNGAAVAMTRPADWTGTLALGGHCVPVLMDTNSMGTSEIWMGYNNSSISSTIVVGTDTSGWQLFRANAIVAPGQITDTEVNSAAAIQESKLALDQMAHACRVATPLNISTTVAPATIDGVVMALNDRVLLLGQTTTSQNGVWQYRGSGNAMIRPIEWAASAIKRHGHIAGIGDGTYKGMTAISTANITVDTSDPVFKITNQKMRFAQATAGTRNVNAYGALSNGPDKVAGLIVAANELIRVHYHAIWNGGAGDSKAAIFIVTNPGGVATQLKWTWANGAPLVSEAGFTGSVNDGALNTNVMGLITMSETGASVTDVTTGQVLGHGQTGGGGGPANVTTGGGAVSIFGLPAGVYDVEVRFLQTSGVNNCNVKNRLLVCEVV